MSRPNASRLGWADALRCLAAVGVVTLHCAGATLAAEDPASTRFLILNLLDGGTRWTVPMFVMLSGMFLLDPDKAMPRKKWLGHVGRLALTLLLWSCGYALWDARGAHMGLEWLLEALIRVVTGQLHYHLWFLPMLLGLYLLVPLFRALVRGASRRVLWYGVGLWFAAAVCLPTLYAAFPGAVGQSWFNLLSLRSLTGYGGYFLLGYLLRTCTLRPWTERALYLAGLAGLAFTWWGTQALSAAAGSFQALLYDYLTPNVALTAGALFVLCRRLDPGKRPAWGRLSQLTLGLYLLHPLFIELAAHFGLPDPAWNVAWCVPLQVLAVCVVSLCLSWLLRHIPKVGKFIC